MLPSHLCNEALGISSECPLPSFIEQQDTHTKTHGYEPVLSRDLAGPKDRVELGHVQEEDGDYKGEEDRWEQKEVSRRFTEEGWVLQDRETAGAGGHEIEPLPGNDD